MRAKAIFTAMLLAVAPLPIVAQDFNAGWIAYNSGNYASALREWKPIAEQCNARAQFFVGLMYSRGQGAVQDDAEAVRWYRPAAEQGIAFAQFALGMSYSLGEGVLQDNVIAHMWVNIAAANGHDVAVEARDYLAGVMTQTDISEAQRRARVCMASNYQDCE